MKVTIEGGRVFDFTWADEDVNLTTMTDDELYDLSVCIIDDREGIEDDFALRAQILDGAFELVTQERMAYEAQGRHRNSYDDGFDVVEDDDGKSVTVMLNDSENAFVWCRFEDGRPVLLLNEEQLDRDDVCVVPCNRMWEPMRARIEGLHVLNPDCEHEVAMMVDRAVYAYAIYEEFLTSWKEHESLRSVGTQIELERSRSEYEATVFCIDMFVEVPLNVVFERVKERARQEMEQEHEWKTTRSDASGGLRL